VYKQQYYRSPSEERKAELREHTHEMQGPINYCTIEEATGAAQGPRYRDN